MKYELQFNGSLLIRYGLLMNILFIENKRQNTIQTLSIAFHHKFSIWRMVKGDIVPCLERRSRSNDIEGNKYINALT